MIKINREELAWAAGFFDGEGSTIATKTTELEILEIRDKYHSGIATQIELSKQYKLSQSSIGRIVNRKTWKHI